MSKKHLVINMYVPENNVLLDVA